MSKRILGQPLLRLLPLLCCVAAGIQAAPFTAVVVYGDSLSDNGNVYAASLSINPLNPIPPDPPYYQGRRSNGPVAVEYLAAGLGVPLVDFAWLGATTGVGDSGDGGSTTSLGTFSLPGMMTTFAATQALLTPSLKSGGLFVVWGGANDLLAPSPLDVSLDPAATLAAIINRAVINEVTLVNSLIALGVSPNHILVPGVPDLGQSPNFKNQGLAMAALGTLFTDLFNSALAANLPGGVMYFDTATLTRNIIANPAAYGLTNSTGSCIVGITVCPDPQDYVFYDDFHPTTEVHAIIGQAFITDTPEPSTILLMFAGLTFCGWKARRRVI